MRLLGSELTLHKLEVFCAVARLEGVTRAAESLHVAQPVVTAHIRSLEEKLGVRLTTRQGRRIKITPEGERVLAWAEDVMSRTHELQRELADSRRGLKGSAVIATSMTVGSYVIPEKIVAFRLEHHDGDISVLTATPRTVIDAIREGRADFGVSILDPQQDLSGLDIEAIGDDELVLACRPKGRFDKPKLTLKQIERMPFVAAQGHSARREIEDSALFRLGAVRRNIILEFGHGEAMMRSVRTDLCVGFLFRSSIEEELRQGSLKIIELENLEVKVSIYIIKRTGKYFSTFQGKLFEFLKNKFRCS
jgi:LysR family transcriptional regulator, low CO2-responsive transcriptional regulator